MAKRRQARRKSAPRRRRSDQYGFDAGLRNMQKLAMTGAVTGMTLGIGMGLARGFSGNN
jgi:hypothetical protein